MNGEVIWDRNKPTDHVSWKRSDEDNMVFRFDDEPTEYFLYRDYHTLPPEKKKIFDRENPFWARFFAGREPA